MKNFPEIRFLFDRKHEATKKKTGLIQIEIAFKRRRKYVSTGVKVYADQWDDRSGVVNRMDCLTLNETINVLKNKIQEWINGLYKEGDVFSFEALESFLKSIRVRRESFLEYVSRRVIERNDITDGTKKNHMKLIPSLEEFGRIESFLDINRQNILAYDDFLHGKYNNQSTIHSYHKFLKVYINDAILHDIIKYNPYTGVKIEKGKTAKRMYLTPEEVEVLETCRLPIGMEKVRDAFLLQCYTGFSYAELASFDFSKVVKRGGKYVVHDKRKKTGEDYYVVLMAPAVRILERYGWKFPVMSNAQYNMRLKLVANYARIDKELTTHMGRHTFAVMALNNGVPIETLAKMMGHTDIKTTQIYGKIMDSQVEDAFDMLEKKINK